MNGRTVISPVSLMSAQECLHCSFSLDAPIQFRVCRLCQPQEVRQTPESSVCVCERKRETQGVPWVLEFIAHADLKKTHSCKFGVNDFLKTLTQNWVRNHLTMHFNSEAKWNQLRCTLSSGLSCWLVCQEKWASISCSFLTFSEEWEEISSCARRTDRKY